MNKQRHIWDGDYILLYTKKGKVQIFKFRQFDIDGDWQTEHEWMWVEKDGLDYRVSVDNEWICERFGDQPLDMFDQYKYWKQEQDAYEEYDAMMYDEQEIFDAIWEDGGVRRTYIDVLEAYSSCITFDPRDELEDRLDAIFGDKANQYRSWFDDKYIIDQYITVDCIHVRNNLYIRLEK